jgi:hypothetical protein
MPITQNPEDRETIIDQKHHHDSISETKLGIGKFPRQ